MSINESIMQQLAMLEKSAAEQMSAISEMRKALGLGELALPASASSSGKVKKQRKSKKAVKAEGGSEGAESGAEQAPKEKGPPSAWNVLVASTVADMKQSGWPAWTDLKGVAWQASRQSMVKDKSGAEHEAYVFDGGDHDGKEPSPALGGMVRASFLKAQADPAAAEKARKYHEKLAEKRSAASSASAGSGEGGEPVADAEGAPVTKKGGGRPKMTEEQKAAAKVKRDAKKAAEPEAEEFTEVAAAPAPPAKKASVLKPKAAAPKKLDLSFFPWTFEGKNYITNDRKDVIEPEEGQWVGRFDGKAIDTSVPEPSDLDGVEMRE